MYALVVRFDLPDAASVAAFDELVATVAPTMVDAEPGTLVYDTHTVIDAPLARIFYEVYRDRAALDEHEARPATAEFLAAIGVSARPCASRRSRLIVGDGADRRFAVNRNGKHNGNCRRHGNC